MNVVFVYNPHSGSALSREELEAHCVSQDVTVSAFVAIQGGYEKELEKYIQNGATIVVYGGDGTLSSVAKLLVGTNAVFAPLAGGTLNHFTKDLGVSQDLDTALGRLADSQPRMIDIGTVNGVLFLNNSSLGLYPNSLKVREELTNSKLTKWLAAIIASIQALIKYRVYTVTIGEETFKTPFLFVGNNDYHLTNIDDSGRKRFDEGILSVYTIKTPSRLRLITILARALIGQLSATPEFKTWKTTSLTIHTRHTRVRVSRDGELEHLTTPLEYKAVSQGLNVLGID